MMSKYRNRIAKRLSHTFYKYDYHIFWTPKYRYKMLEGKISSQLSRDIHALSLTKDVEVEELNIQYHVHPLCWAHLNISHYIFHT